jgi:aminoglycoside/choline kinase family phosphotransferase
MNRARSIEAFLARHGFAAARAEPLAQDASFRRYLRLIGGPRPAVLMDAPPPEDIRPFVRIAAHLGRIGITVPEIIAADESEGLLIEEDLGDELYSIIIAGTKVRTTAVKRLGAKALKRAMKQANPLPQGEGEPSSSSSSPASSLSFSSSTFSSHALLFNSAVDVLVAIQRVTAPSTLPKWDAAAMASAALATLFDWWWPAMFSSPAPDAAREDFAVAFDAMLAPVAAGPTCFVHRDFFAGNLIWLPKRSGVRRVGVLDFQSAAIGHPAYDLVSLLQDARREIPDAIANRAITRYLAARPELHPTEFRAAYAACAAQRHLRVATQWVRLARRDSRPDYLVHGPRTWRLLEQAVREPAAAPLAAALDRWIPPVRRANPPDPAA